MVVSEINDYLKLKFKWEERKELTQKRVKVADSIKKDENVIDIIKLLYFIGSNVRYTDTVVH